MAGGYEVQNPGDIAVLFDTIAAIRAEVKEIGRPDASQTAQALQTLTDLVNGLIDQVNGIFTGYVQAGTTITAAGDVTSTGGRGYFGGTLWSVGSSATDLSTLPGLRQTTWQIYTAGNTGLYGYSPSSFRSKTHWKKAGYTAAQFLACFPYVYEYRGQISIRDDKRNPNYDPNYVVPIEVGYLAELLIKNGLGQFVTMKDGVPIGIDYAAFAAVGMTIIGRELMARLDAQDARIVALDTRLQAAGF